MLRPIHLAGADLAFDPGFLAPDEAAALFARLRQEITWETHRIRLFGRMLDAPRLSCWVGDAGARYTYSGSRFEPRPWTPVLLHLRAIVSAACGANFNSVLANRYRDGCDSMGWHGDDEPELGPRPAIASLSLGATRRFVLKHRQDATLKLACELGPGALLLMRGQTQENYRHALPKTKKAAGERINLTFRHILP